MKFVQRREGTRQTRRSGTKSNWRRGTSKQYGLKAVMNFRTKSNG